MEHEKKCNKGKDCFNCPYSDCIWDEIRKQNSEYMRRYWEDPELREKQKKRCRTYYQKNKKRCIESSRRYKQEHKDEINAKRRAAYASSYERREKQREYSARYYAKKKAERERGNANAGKDPV